MLAKAAGVSLRSVLLLPAASRAPSRLPVAPWMPAAAACRVCVSCRAPGSVQHGGGVALVRASVVSASTRQMTGGLPGLRVLSRARLCPAWGWGRIGPCLSRQCFDAPNDRPALSSMGVGSHWSVPQSSVLRMRADCGGHLFTAKLDVVVHYSTHQGVRSVAGGSSYPWWQRRHRWTGATV